MPRFLSTANLLHNLCADFQLKALIFEHFAAMKPVANTDRPYMPLLQLQ